MSKDIVKVIKLIEPIEAHGKEITELKIRKPRGKDFKKMRGDAFDQPMRAVLDFAAHLADVPPSTIDGMCAEDCAELHKTVNPFLEIFLPTGQT